MTHRPHSREERRRASHRCEHRRRYRVPPPSSDRPEATPRTPSTCGCPTNSLALFAGKPTSSARTARRRRTADRPATTVTPAGDDLLDSVGDWGPTATPRAPSTSSPYASTATSPLISRWMNDPAVAAFWELAGPETRHRGPPARPARRRRPQRALSRRAGRHPDELLGDLPRRPRPAGPPLPRPSPRHRNPPPHRRRRRPRAGPRHRPAPSRRRPRARPPPLAAHASSRNPTCATPPPSPPS